MLKNKKVDCGFDIPVHFSRLIASWNNVGGNAYSWLFEDWLKSLGLSDRDARDCYEMYTCGKLEVEFNAKHFIEEHEND